MTTRQSSATTVVQPDLLSLVASKHRDGSVVLSATHDRIFKLNGVGALTWTILEQSPAALNLDELVEILSTHFDNSNHARQLPHEISRQQLTLDTARFINDLASNDLLLVTDDANGRPTYRVAESTSATTSTTIDAVIDAAAQAEPSHLVGPPAGQAHVSETHPTKRETLTALFGLLAFDFLLRFRGFEALISKVENWPTLEPRNTDLEVCRHVCAMVNRAQVYYPRKAMCLQHSAVVTCLLRRRGVPAQMVLAAQEFPPKAHAWVDVAGTVVNDSQQVKTRYRELRRI
jgi:Transglutaminase-like superfamily/Coenzyme PQQ synthesis protein D (PqqD)